MSDFVKEVQQELVAIQRLAQIADLQEAEDTRQKFEEIIEIESDLGDAWCQYVCG